jgi:hypothetical protein
MPHRANRERPVISAVHRHIFRLNLGKPLISTGLDGMLRHPRNPVLTH